MYHYFQALTNTKGDSLVGYFARLIDPVTGGVVTIASDANGTPVATVSGVANMCLTDAAGNLDFYVAAGTYHLDIYGTDATTFVRRTASVPMGEVKAAVAPSEFGAVGDGVTDDTAAMQAAFNSGRSVQLTQGKTFLIKSKLTISTAGITISGGGKLKAGAWNFANDTDGGGTHLRMIFVTAANVTFDGVQFDATGVTPGAGVENCFLWVTGASLSATSCQFVGLPKGTCVLGVAGSYYLSFEGNLVSNCTGGVFVRERGAVVANNRIINATDAAIALNGTACMNAVVSDNNIINENLAVIPSMIGIEEGASEWTITGNTLIGVRGGGIVTFNDTITTPVIGGVIANNVIDGKFAGTLPAVTDPAALLAVSAYYTDVVIHDNIVRNCPTGNANSRLAIVPATGGSFHDNLIDGSATTGLSALVNISAGTGGLTLKDNKSTAPASARHYLFTAGAYGSIKVLFLGGKFYAGASGIDAELNIGSITNLIVQVENPSDNTSTNFINAPTLLGDRATFLNAGAWERRPCLVGAKTSMYCSADPSTAGTQAWVTGDTFYRLTPVSGAYIGITRVSGAWKNFGAIL